MRTRSSGNWRRAPGGWDALHTSRIYSGARDYLGIPELQPQPTDWLLPCRPCLRPYRHRSPEGAIGHFFLDDYRFESVWRAPRKSLRHVRRFDAVLTPDFSMLVHWPPALQIYNVYRNRWMGRYWQEAGLAVIPTVCWSTPESYRVAFAGIPPRQVVALAVPDVRSEAVKARFLDGYLAMLDALVPRQVLVYGRLPDEVADNAVPTVEVPPAWIGLRQRVGAACDG